MFSLEEESLIEESDEACSSLDELASLVKKEIPSLIDEEREIISVDDNEEFSSFIVDERGACLLDDEELSSLVDDKFEFSSVEDTEEELFSLIDSCLENEIDEEEASPWQATRVHVINNNVPILNCFFIIFPPVINAFSFSPISIRSIYFR